ncbi:MAG TPA: hypothetical protein VGR21_09890, partial [Cryptosporangiaceae bacterium]|nr:hypothetical protein [Cryptosporangiaceae bacterium]
MIVEHRFLRTPDGAVWTRAGCDRHFWNRYLSVFDSVRVVARVRQVTAVPAGAARVDGGPVEVWPVPHYVGPAAYLARRRSVHRSVLSAVGDSDAVVLRAPSVLAGIVSG